MSIKLASHRPPIEDLLSDSKWLEDYSFRVCDQMLTSLKISFARIITLRLTLLGWAGFLKLPQSHSIYNDICPKCSKHFEILTSNTSHLLWDTQGRSNFYGIGNIRECHLLLWQHRLLHLALGSPAGFCASRKLCNLLPTKVQRRCG